MIADPRWLPTLLFIATVGGLVVLCVGAIRRSGSGQQRNRRWSIGVAGGLMLWLVLTGGLAATGVLGDFTRMPPLVLVLAGAAGLLTIGLALSPVGARLVSGISLPWLVGYQAFRIVVEIALAQLYHAGALPVQMTIEGRNLDLISGVSALVLAWLATRWQLPRWGLLAWNLLGLGLLLNIVIVSILSTPVPFRLFMNEPANTIITELPFIWLPTLLVPAALFGHLLVFRRLWRERGALSGVDNYAQSHTHS